MNEELEERKREKRIWDALCVDYTSVHYCDLQTDAISTIKTGAVSYAGLVMQAKEDEDTARKLRSFSYRMKYYFDHYIVQESAPDFLEIFSADALMEALRRQKRVIYRFRAKPNRSGQQYFEVQVARVPGGGGSEVVMGFRYIDDLMGMQEYQKTKLEEALAEARLNNEIISSISKIYWMIYRMDLVKGIYEEVSAGEEMHRLTGKSGNITEMLRDTVDNMIAPEYQEIMRLFLNVSTLSDRMKNRETISMEYLAADGIWYMARFIVKKRDENRQVTNVLYLVIEIDGQKRQALKYQEELRVVAEEAKRANIAKTDFLRRMSHDIRTPINGILGMLQVAEHFADDTEKLRECREKMKASAEYLLNLMNSVLDMNKLESGKILPQENPFDFRDVLRDIDNLVGTQAIEKGIKLKFSKHNVTHNFLIGSPLYLRQIFMNIGTNAVKYTESGGVIEVSFEEIPINDEMSLYRLTVKDTGIGIGDEFKDRIFDAFAQEESGMVEAKQGTGLGMAICKQLTDLLNGKIWFESEKGKGTTFIVEIPIKFDQNRIFEDEKKIKASKIEGKKILIVEDNELNAEIVQVMLEEAGATVEIASNGEQAVELFTASRPGEYAVVLMDIMMPVMNGYEATRVIRELEHEDAEKIPIIAMSANAFQEDVMECRAAGMNRHLAKPVNEKKLLLAIEEYL